MSRRRREQVPGAGESVPFTTGPPGAPASGIVRKEELDAQLASSTGEPPPWHVVHAYLASGEHSVWVEGYAAASRPFADVLAALRNDHEESQGVVLPFRSL